MAQISVIIVNYNAHYFLKICVASVLRSTAVQQPEIIVVDNNSTDDSCKMLSREYPEVILIQNKVNQGFSKANNQGVAVAKGDYVLILNPDTILPEHALKQVLECCKADAQTGAVGVAFLDGRGQFLPESKRNFPSISIAGLKLLGHSKNYYASQINRADNAVVEILTGAFMFMRKTVYQEVGGFDEDFFMYGEDIDLSYRISKAGYNNYYLGKLNVLHFKGESTLRDKRYIQNFYGAFSIFYKKHFQNNTLFDKSVDAFIKGLILLKSFTLKKTSVEDTTIENWLYFGKNEATYQRLFKKFPGSKGKMIEAMEEINSGSDTIFMDSAYLTFGRIIEIIRDQQCASLRKRIIAEDASYYLGSDASDKRGEVVLF